MLLLEELLRALLAFLGQWVVLGEVKSDSKIYALLATARIANVPSVLSNLGVGVFLGWVSSESDFAWPWLLSVAAVMFYVGGNFLNDWADCEWDRENRPERALPRGMFPKGFYLAKALGSFIGGLALTIPYGVGALGVAVVLVVLICLYTKIHKLTPFSVIPMGLCRACLPVLGFLGVRDDIAPQVLYPSAALLIYIIALSVSARWESKGDIPPEKKLLARGALIASGLVAAALPLLTNPVLGWIGLVPFAVWLWLSLTKYRSPVPAHVSALLAGIPLIDWIALLPVALMLYGHDRVMAGEPAFLMAVFLPPVSFVAGRALQRVAPAT
ncbi:MAG: UbiA family prenyltransferase [Akkermansiaceae bacterium]